MDRMLTQAIVVAICLGVCAAHMCLLSPPQRGSMQGINKAGADDCFLRTPRCGGRPSAGPIMALKRGQNFTVTFQKNLDHFNKTNPGAFHVLMGVETGGTQLHVLASVPDKGEPSLTLYSVNITIPMDYKAGKEYLLQTVYLTNNDEVPEFFQCSDVMIV